MQSGMVAGGGHVSQRTARGAASRLAIAEPLLAVGMPVTTTVAAARMTVRVLNPNIAGLVGWLERREVPMRLVGSCDWRTEELTKI